MRTSAYLLIVMALTGCAAQASPPPTLKERIAAAETPQEQQRIMRNACLTEAEWRKDQLVSYQRRHYGGRHANASIPYMPDVERLKSICWEMTELYQGEK